MRFSSTAAGAQPGGSCNVLEVEYDASGQRIRERAGATTRYFLDDDLSHVPAEASPGGIGVQDKLGPGIREAEGDWPVAG